MEKKTYTKAHSKGRNLLDKLYSPHRDDQGGWVVQIVGKKGSGKTAATLSFLNNALHKYPTERVWFSECLNAALQCFKLNPDDVQLFAEKDKIVFRDRDRKMKPTNRLDVIEFTDIEDLYEKSIPGKVNVPFFESRTTWLDLVAYLTHDVGEWQHVFIDEMNELTPAGAGEVWRDNAWFSSVLKDARKSFVSLYWNTQMAEQLDWRVRKMAMMKIFLPGSQTSNRDRTWQNSVWSLQQDDKRGNEFWIEETGGHYGKCRLTDIWKPRKGYHFDAHPTYREGDYYCKKCDRKHKVNSRKGQEHLKYAR